MPVTLPERPPFTLRARLLSALPDGSALWEPDGLIGVDASGRIVSVGSAAASAEGIASAAKRVPDAEGTPLAEPIDLRPLVVMPGLVDTHVHIPQVPAAGLGAGMDLLAWLERYVFPLERRFDARSAEQLAPQVYRAMASAGTTTFAGYGAIWADSLDVCFQAAEAHGIRAFIGKVMMDRITYDDRLPPGEILETSLRQTADLCERWDGAADGRLRYAVTPRFAVSCSADMLRESAALAAHHGVLWQTHLSEDQREIRTVAEQFPDAVDYLDVYERAGGVGPRALFAHAIHLSDRELTRLAEAGAAIAHCPVSNMFIRSGIMPLTHYKARGVRIGLGSDVAGAPELSIVTQMRAGFFQQNARSTMLTAEPPAPGPLEWLRLGTLGGAEALGLGEVIGSLEVGKEADLIAVDAEVGAPPGSDAAADLEELVSRLIFRERLGMVRGAWVRGRRLPMGEGPDGLEVGPRTMLAAHA